MLAEASVNETLSGLDALELAPAPEAADVGGGEARAAGQLPPVPPPVGAHARHALPCRHGVGVHRARS